MIIDSWYEEDEGEFDDTGWESFDSSSSTDSDAYHHGAEMVLEAQKRGFDKVMIVFAGDADNIRSYGKL